MLVVAEFLFLTVVLSDVFNIHSIFDGILEGPVQQHPFMDATKLLLEKLGGRWVSLALHHVGHHMVKKVFHALASMDDKAVLAGELSKGIVRLNTKSSGRTIIVECAVKDFLESKATWTASVSKRNVKAAIVDELWQKHSDDMEQHSKGKKRKHKQAKVI